MIGALSGSNTAFLNPTAIQGVVDNAAIGTARVGLGSGWQGNIESFNASPPLPPLPGMSIAPQLPQILSTPADQTAGSFQLPGMTITPEQPNIEQGPSAETLQGPQIWTMAENSLRNLPGTATTSTPLPPVTGQWLRGSDGNAGLVPAQVTEQLQGQQFNNFGDFRAAFWKAVANVPELAVQFSGPNLGRMQQGFAPVAPASQQYGGQRSYVLHHQLPIAQGGEVYDMSNIIVVTPGAHQSILDPKFHFGSGAP